MPSFLDLFNHPSKPIFPPNMVMDSYGGWCKVFVGDRWIRVAQIETKRTVFSISFRVVGMEEGLQEIVQREEGAMDWLVWGPRVN